MSLMSPALPPDAVRCCVVAGETDTPYTRAGRGEPVVILTADTDMAARLLTELPRRFQAIAPDPRVHRDFSAWLRGFLEALGLPSASLIVDSAFAPDAIYFALHDPDRVNRMAFIAANGQAFLSTWGDETSQNTEEIAAYFGN
jgi:pimeloyl-ACP methyl ester carboxylesterase